MTEGRKVINNGKYELVDVEGIEVLSYGGKYSPVKYVSRHRTAKCLVEITVSAAGKDPVKVVVTTDHICMVYDRDRLFQNTAAGDLMEGDYVSVYDADAKTERQGTIAGIKDLGTTEECVYDLEVDDTHCFYANDVLIHNSIFLNLEPVTAWMRKQNSLPDAIKDWKKKDKRALWDEVFQFVEKDVNGFVRGLAHNFCHTSR